MVLFTFKRPVLRYFPPLFLQHCTSRLWLTPEHTRIFEYGTEFPDMIPIVKYLFFVCKVQQRKISAKGRIEQWEIKLFEPIYLDNLKILFERSICIRGMAHAWTQMGST
jgi:hypothetical protein